MILEALVTYAAALAALLGVLWVARRIRARRVRREWRRATGGRRKHMHIAKTQQRRRESIKWGVKA